MQKSKKFLKIFAVFIISFSLIITASAADSLIPLGHTAGIRLCSDGAIVIDFSRDIENNPARDAGLSPGDVITSVDGHHIASNTDLRNAITKSDGNSVKVEYMRNGETKCAEIAPVKNKNGESVIGIWVRDSIAGIGTLTYFDPETKTYGALGHGISGHNGNQLIPTLRGELTKSIVAGVRRGESGNPGELVGEYDLDEKIADIEKNTDGGIFGKVADDAEFNGMKSFPVAKNNEVRCGTATIISNISGDKVEEFEVEIAHIFTDGENTKNMLIRVTDKNLLEKTGGIVRGMSGSPIVQNGKLVGAVTHVLVNDPTRGYGIFIENMLDAAG